MSLIIIFDPESDTLNSIPYSLYPCPDCQDVLGLGADRPLQSRSNQLSTPDQSQYWFTTRHRLQTDGNNEADEIDSALLLHNPSEQDLSHSSQQSEQRVRFQPLPLLGADGRVSLTRPQPSFANPFSKAHSLQREDSDCSDISSLFDKLAFSTHRDTLARLGKLPRSEEEYDDEISLVGIANRLPNEIILQIFELLSPVDYDSARHTCRNWFYASLNNKLATNMLRYSGSYSAFLLDLDLERQRSTQRDPGMYSAQSSDDEKDNVSIDQEWLMSKRLATEARLGATWRGSGIRTGTNHSLSNFSIVNVFEFHQPFSIARSQAIADANPRSCTVSLCGTYLLLTVDCEILVYNLCEADVPIAPHVRIVACRRVLAISMDTSSGRYAVAALLEGRLGCLWNLKPTLESISSATQVGESLDLSMRTDLNGLASLGVSKAIPMQMHSEKLTEASNLTSTHSFLSEHEEILKSSHGFEPCRTESPGPIWSWIDDNYEKNDDLQYLLDDISPPHSPVDIITKPVALYTNLGTTSDIPRSVAICPQRRCVAFGYRTGIELHWEDNATAASLNR